LAEQYSETVSPPARLLLVIATIISLLVTIAWGAVLVPVVDSIQKEIPFLLSVFAACWVIMSVMLLLTKKIKIKVKEIQQFSGQPGPTLFIRFSSRDSKSYIPLHLIDEVEEVSFGGPWWNTSMIDAPAAPAAEQEAEPDTAVKKQSWWRDFLMLRDKDGPIPLGGEVLYGYRGPGLIVTYRAKTLAGGGDEYKWKCQFPTQNPKRLKAILTSGIR
tara:strand:- start:6520 stop:7167 length:648 start_codon:yes stop_codon:yes gene_type:complete